jgi:hypothetical protein
VLMTFVAELLCNRLITKFSGLGFFHSAAPAQMSGLTGPAVRSFQTTSDIPCTLHLWSLRYCST